MDAWQRWGDRRTGIASSRAPARPARGGTADNHDHELQDFEPFVNRTILNWHLLPSSRPPRRPALPTAMGDAEYLDVSAASHPGPNEQQLSLADRPEGLPSRPITGPKIHTGVHPNSKLCDLKSKLRLKVPMAKTGIDVISRMSGANKESTTAPNLTEASKQETVPEKSGPPPVVPGPRSSSGKRSLQVEVSITKGKSSHDKSGRKLRVKSVVLSVEGILRRLLGRGSEDECLVEGARSTAAPEYGLYSSCDSARENKAGRERGNQMQSGNAARHPSAVTAGPSREAKNAGGSSLTSVSNNAGGSRLTHQDINVSISYTAGRNEPKMMTGTTSLSTGTTASTMPSMYSRKPSSQRPSYTSASRKLCKEIPQDDLSTTSTADTATNIRRFISANKVGEESALISKTDKESRREPEGKVHVAKNESNAEPRAVSITRRRKPSGQRSKSREAETKAKPVRTMRPTDSSQDTSFNEAVTENDIQDGGGEVEHPNVPLKKGSHMTPLAHSSGARDPECGAVVAYAELAPKRAPNRAFAWETPRKKFKLFRFHQLTRSTDALASDRVSFQPDHGSKIVRPLGASGNITAESEGSSLELAAPPPDSHSLKSAAKSKAVLNGVAGIAGEIGGTEQPPHVDDVRTEKGGARGCSVQTPVVVSNRNVISLSTQTSMQGFHKAPASVHGTPSCPVRDEYVGMTEKGNYTYENLSVVGGIAQPGTDTLGSPLLPTPQTASFLSKEERHVEHEEGSSEELICGLCFCFLLILLLLLLLLFLTLHVSFEPRPTASTVHPGTTATGTPGLTVYYCSTASCNLEGQYIKSLLSTSREPCDNFYDYVCEVWSKHNPHDASGVGSAVSPDTLLESVTAKHTLSSLISTTDKDVKVASDLFQECSDRSKIGSAVISAREVLRRWAIRDWPRTGSSSTMNEVWTLAGELIRDFGVGGIVSVNVGVDPDFLDRTIVELSEPELIFFRSDETQQQLVTLFRGAIKEIATGFGVDTVSQETLATDVITVFERIAYAVESINIKGRGRGPPVLKVIELDGGMRTLLDIVFLNVTQIGLSTTVVLKSPHFLQYGLPQTLRNLPPGSILNYLGFLALIRLAPFFPERLRDLRQLFSKSVTGRASSDVTDTSSLCLRAVDKVLPSCLSKAYMQFSLSAGTSVITREWISQLEGVFGQQISKLYWIDELSALLVRYRMKTWQLVRLSPYSDIGSCSPDDRTPAVSPLHFYHHVSVLRQQQEIQNILKSGDLRGWKLAQSIFSSRPTYDPTRQVVYVPAGLVNSSVPTASTLFTFHLARAAVRVYRALAEILFDDNIYVREAPLRFTEESHRRLDDLLDCFERDIRQLPRALGPGSLLMDTSSVRRAALAQTVALHLAFRAFRELLHARRIWHLDFRFKTLPTVSADKLFFLYFALDNCEAGDSVYRFESARSRLPAEHLVNVPLRHMPEFTKLFSCKSGSSMVVPKIAVCEVAKPLQVRRFRSRS